MREPGLGGERGPSQALWAQELRGLMEGLKERTEETLSVDEALLRGLRLFTQWGVTRLHREVSLLGVNIAHKYLGIIERWAEQKVEQERQRVDEFIALKKRDDNDSLEKEGSKSVSIDHILTTSVFQNSHTSKKKLNKELEEIKSKFIKESKLMESKIEALEKEVKWL